MNSVSDTLVQELKSALPPRAFPQDVQKYLEEPRGAYKGRAGVVVAPGSAEEVAAVVRLAAKHRVPVVPYGGGTGLVGGQVMPDGPLPVVLSLERMQSIRAVYPEENVIVAEAGAILASVQGAAVVSAVAGVGRVGAHWRFAGHQCGRGQRVALWQCAGAVPGAGGGAAERCDLARAEAAA